MRTAAASILQWLEWLTVVGLLAALLGIVAPGRGAAWFNDDGLFLALSWNAAHGFGLDFGTPQAPHYLFNALFMKAGLTGLLAFRYLNYVVSLVSSMVFFLGLERRRFQSAVVPVAICASLLISLDSVQGPNSLALAFFLAGAGTYFFAATATGGYRSTLLAASGILLGLAGFMHAAVALAMAIVVALVLAGVPSVRRSLFAPAFLVTSLALWGWYAAALGPAHLLVAPGGHDARAGHLVRRLWEISQFYLEAALIYAAAVLVLWRLGRRRFAAAQGVLCLAVTLFYGATLLADVLGMNPPRPLLGWFFLSGKGQWISRVPGTVYYLLLFSAFRWIGEHWNVFDLRAGLAQFRADSRSVAWAVGIVGLVLLHVATQTGSNTAVIQGMVFFAGPALGLTIVIWNALDREQLSFAPLRWFVSGAWLALFAVFAFTYNHPTDRRVIAAGRVTLTDSPLRGVLESPGYARSMAQLETAYRANGCAILPLVALEYVPMAIYALQHASAVGVDIVRPSMGFPEGRVRAALDAQQGWCVLDATGDEMREEITRQKGFDTRAAVRAWLLANSDRVIPIESPSPDLTDVRLYVRNARERRP